MEETLLCVKTLTVHRPISLNSKIFRAVLSCIGLESWGNIVQQILWRPTGYERHLCRGLLGTSTYAEAVVVFRRFLAPR